MVLRVYQDDIDKVDIREIVNEFILKKVSKMEPFGLL